MMESFPIKYLVPKSRFEDRLKHVIISIPG